jgi:hypothetical protein
MHVSHFQITEALYFMDDYCELCFAGTDSSLNALINFLKELKNKDWTIVSTSIAGIEYLQCKYNGALVDKASVFLHRDSDDILKVVNIVPTVKAELTIAEYNAVLRLFDKDLIRPSDSFLNQHNITVKKDLTGLFNPLNYLSKEAYDKLISFSQNADRTSLPPFAEEKWYDFVIQTVNDNMVIDSASLSSIMQGKEFLGQYVWTPQETYELCTRYDDESNLLKYFLKRKE